MQRQPRVLFAPLNIANNWWTVSRVLREWGVHADVATVERSQLVARGDFDLTLPELSPVRRGLKKAAFCAWALRHYDVIHYTFAHSILEYTPRPTWLMDLRAASLLHKPMVMTFHGCEVRGTGAGSCSLCPDGCDMDAKRRRLALVRRHVKRLFVTTPDLLLDVPEAEWVPQAVETVRTATVLEPKTTGPFVVTHAPSRRSAKGTESVIAACQTLRSEGFDVELQLIEGMDHEQALAAYRRADVAVDQLLIGWYGVFAVEMMALGKPVVCYINQGHLRRAGLQDLPIINARPDNLADVLRELIERRSELSSIGASGSDYVRAMHDPARVAHRYLRAYAELSQEAELTWPETQYPAGESDSPCESPS